VTALGWPHASLLALRRAEEERARTDLARAVIAADAAHRLVAGLPEAGVGGPRGSACAGDLLSAARFAERLRAGRAAALARSRAALEEEGVARRGLTLARAARQGLEQARQRWWAGRLRALEVAREREADDVVRRPRAPSPGPSPGGELRYPGTGARRGSVQWRSRATSSALSNGLRMNSSAPASAARRASSVPGRAESISTGPR